VSTMTHQEPSPIPSAPTVGRTPDDSSDAATPWTMSPRSIELVGVGIALSILVAATLARRLSTDVFWSLVAGEWILRHHSMFGTDSFTYTEPHRRWIADEWGSEVVLASMFKAFGSWAYNLYAIGTGTASLLCALAYTRALGARGGRVAGMMILLALGIAPVITQDRGVSFSLIWLPLELLVLTKARSNPRWLWWLPVLLMCWVNTHGTILIGLFILGVELAWAAAPTRLLTAFGGVGRSPYPGQLAVASAVAVLASCISPYGPGLLLYDLKVTTNSQIGGYFAEWQSPDFHSMELLVFYCVPLLIFILAVRSGRVMVLEGSLCILLFLAALHSERFIVYLFIATCGLASCLPSRPPWGARYRRVAGALIAGIFVAVLAAPSVPAGSVTSDTPVRAFNFLAPHPGRIFTQETWEDYAVLRHRATFLDGRADYFSGSVFSEFFDVTGVSSDPDQVLSHYDVKYVVWARGTPLYVYLDDDPKWQVIDRTGPAVVFARRST
jgi:hypothetical protein